MNSSNPKSKRRIVNIGRITSTNSADITTIFMKNSNISMKHHSRYDLSNGAIVITSIMNNSSHQDKNDGSLIACGVIRQGNIPQRRKFS